MGRGQHRPRSTGRDRQGPRSTDPVIPRQIDSISRRRVGVIETMSNVLTDDGPCNEITTEENNAPIICNLYTDYIVLML